MSISRKPAGSTVTQDPKQMRRYGNGFTLMPAHRPRDKMVFVSRRTGKKVEKALGKSPIDKNWTTKKFPSREVVIKRCVAEKRNVGVRIEPGQIVIDVDPRNGGNESFERLQNDFDFDAADFPCTITGGGGAHYWAKVKRGLNLFGELKESYPGVEFKTVGRQVIAAGSVHPNGKPYRWSDDHPHINDGLPPFPPKLLNAITKPNYERGSTGSNAAGSYTPDQLRAALSVLDAATLVRDEGDWFRYTCAASHAVAGDDEEGAQAWADFCTSDPDYADAADDAFTLWSRIDPDKIDGITVALLNKALRDAGRADLIPARADAADDFDEVRLDDGDSWLEGGSVFEGWLEGKKSKPVLHQVGGLLYQNASEVEPERINWLWPNRIASGKINFVAGFPDQGKSQITCDMGARVSNGGDWPNGEGAAPAGTVLMLSAEDGAADTVVPRLKAAGADLDKIKIVAPTVKTDAKGRRMFNFAEDLHRLTQLVRLCGDVRLVIIDPISAYMGGKGTADTYKNTEVRAVLAPLAEWAEHHDIAVVFVSHFNKNGSGRALSRLTDSLAFGALARCGWLVVPERNEDGETGRKLFLRGKNNLAADAGGIVYTIESKAIDGDIGSSRIVWREPVQVTADDALTQGDARPTAQDYAVRFLSDALEDGPVTVTRLKKKAEEQSLSWRTVERAKDFLGVTSQKLDFGRGWQWSLNSRGAGRFHIDFD